MKMKERTGTYVLAEENLTIIETSASPSIPFIIDGLKKLNFSLSDIKYIIVTHIHLDHAGGAGLLLEQCPNATVVVHPKGARHLINPAKLIKGAKAVYGEQFDELFHPILPIPENKILIMDDKDELHIGKECTLTFYHTPGHAYHHFSIYHSVVNGMFTGDTAGVRYPELYKDGVELYLPSTSPNQFNPEETLESIKLYESMKLDYIFFGHYGMSATPAKVYQQIHTWLPIFLNEAEEAYQQSTLMSEQIKATKERLSIKVTEHLQSLGIGLNHPVYNILALDISVCSMGLIDYLQKKYEAVKHL
ncbi:MBL fold metallo-hydrolase [Bacillus aquiflavi]|nr:MBL fold metallo-hydrolase [Bacillus aquiflavi]UAC49977.1 MBL fold metallo-hydrolase [Bacillus aquiflavi]